VNSTTEVEVMKNRKKGKEKRERGKNLEGEKGER